MTTSSLVYLVFLLTGFASMVWTFAGLTIAVAKLRGSEPPKAIRTVYHELRPFYLLLVLVSNVSWAIARQSTGPAYFLLTVDILCWFAYKDIDDDDRWKRRRTRIAERVAQVGGRLTVVPGGAS